MIRTFHIYWWLSDGGGILLFMCPISDLLSWVTYWCQRLTDISDFTVTLLVAYWYQWFILSHLLVTHWWRCSFTGQWSHLLVLTVWVTYWCQWHTDISNVLLLTSISDLLLSVIHTCHIYWWLIDVGGILLVSGHISDLLSWVTYSC